VKFKDYFSFALSALMRIKIRSALTIGGVMIGIGAMVLLVSLGAQAKRAMIEQLTGQPSLKTITVMSPRLIHLRKARQSQASREEALELPALDDAALAKFGKIEGVVQVFPNIYFRAKGQLADVEEQVLVTNISPGVTAERIRPKLREGAFFSSDNAREVIVTAYLAESLVSKGSIISQEIELTYYYAEKPKDGKPGSYSLRERTEKFKVVAVVREDEHIETGVSALTMGLPSNAVVLPEKQALRLYGQRFSPEMLDPSVKNAGQEHMVVSVVLDDARPEVVQRVRDEIKKLNFPTRHLYDQIDMLKVVFTVMQAILGALGSIALLVAGLQIVNTMSMSILERTREIGVMKAVGARNRDIRRLFVFESCLIGVIGSLLGIAGAWVCGRIMEFGLFQLMLKKMMGPDAEQMTLFFIPNWLMLGGITFGVGVSLIAAIIPAHRAARVDPVHALRRD